MNHQNHLPPPGAAPVGEPARAYSLEQRLAARPHLRQRCETILDVLEQDIADGVTADQAEAPARDQVRALGQERLHDWAVRSAAPATDRALVQQPHTIKDRKKNSAGSRPLAASR